MNKKRILVVVVAVLVLSLLVPQAVTRAANPPWFGQGCGTSYKGPGELRAGGYPPQNLTQDQRQWLFEVFGNNGLASVGYGGQSCPWQQTQPDPPHQAWFGQGCNTSYTGPGGLRAGGYDPTKLSRQQRQWLFEVFGNNGYASEGYGGQTCPWQQSNNPPPQQPPPTQPPAPPSSGGNGNNGNSGGGSSSSCSGALPPHMVVGAKGRVPLEGGSQDYTAVRDKPQGKIIAKVYSGKTFMVKSGPVCTKAIQGHLNWWKVDYNGTVGWMPEGYTGGPYWIEPMPKGNPSSSGGGSSSSIPSCNATSGCVMREKGDNARWWADSWAKGRCTGQSDEDWIVTYNTDNSTWKNANPVNIRFYAAWWSGALTYPWSAKAQVEDGMPPGITLCLGSKLSENDIRGTWV